MNEKYLTQLGESVLLSPAVEFSPLCFYRDFLQITGLVFG